MKQLIISRPIVLLTIAFSIFFELLTGGCLGQGGPLRGSGKIVSQSFNFNNFDKIELEDLDGKVMIEAGKAFAVSTAVDDNLQDLLKVAVTGGTLSIKLKGNLNNRLYVENTKINITVTLPKLSYVFHRGNGTVTVNGIAGNFFRIRNTGNGSAFLSGEVDALEIVCRDNGSVDAKKLKAKKLDVTRSGNGNVYADADEIINEQSNGNGRIIKNQESMKQSSAKNIKMERPLTSIRNLTNGKVKLSVKYPLKGAYGIDIKPNGIKQEYFPIGTKIYKGNQFTAFKKPLFVITEQNRNDTLIVNQ